jgi:hypothetical protein
MKEDKTNKTKSKLYGGLITDSAKSPIELKFTNYSINNYQGDFSQGQKAVRTKIPNSGINADVGYWHTSRGKSL